MFNNRFRKTFMLQHGGIDAVKKAVGSWAATQ